MSVGTGWAEVYMGGSAEAERALFAEIMPRVERIQDAVAANQRSTVKRAFHNKARSSASGSMLPLRCPRASASGFSDPAQAIRASAGSRDRRASADAMATAISAGSPFAWRQTTARRTCCCPIPRRASPATRSSS